MCRRDFSFKADIHLKENPKREMKNERDTCDEKFNDITF